MDALDVLPERGMVFPLTSSTRVLSGMQCAWRYLQLQRSLRHLMST